MNILIEIYEIYNEMMRDITQGVRDHLLGRYLTLSTEGEKAVEEIVTAPLYGELRAMRSYIRDYANHTDTRRFVVNFKPIYMTLDLHYEYYGDGCYSLDIEYGTAFKMVCKRILQELYENPETNFWERPHWDTPENPFDKESLTP